MKLSIALCTFNGSRYLSKQLDSIINQSSVIPFEIIVCDDKSTDNTLKILSEYETLYPNVFKIYNNDINLGSTKNFEKAILLCSGDYIFLSDQDDIWRKDKIKKILAVFDKNPTAEGVFSDGNFINYNQNSINSDTIWESVFFLEKELPKPIDFFDVISKNGNVVTGATLCIKNKTRDFIFPFITGVLHDESITISLSLRKTLFYSTENLISYRIHTNQQVGMKNRYKIEKKNRIKRIILGLDKPFSFSDYRILQKKKFLKLKRSNEIQQHTISTKQINNLKIKCVSEYNEIKVEMTAKFPVRFLIYKLMDKLLGKRKVERLK